MLNVSSKSKAVISVKNQGVFLNTMFLKDTSGVRISEEFDFFAGLEYLPDAQGNKMQASFPDLIQSTNNLVDWHGFNGGDFQSTEDFYKAIENMDFEALEKWFVAPIEITQSMYQNKNAEGLSNIFKEESGLTLYHPSITPSPVSGYMKTVDFVDGGVYSIQMTHQKQSIVPIRAVHYSRRAHVYGL